MTATRVTFPIYQLILDAVPDFSGRFFANNQGQRLIVGLTVFSKMVRTKADLWQVARTTLQGPDLLAET